MKYKLPTEIHIHIKCFTVRPRDTRPQAARTLTMHDFELGPKNFEMHVFDHFYFRCTILHDLARSFIFSKWISIISLCFQECTNKISQGRALLGSAQTAAFEMSQ
jgi:hypothetical protein